MNGADQANLDSSLGSIRAALGRIERAVKVSIDPDDSGWQVAFSDVDKRVENLELQLDKSKLSTMPTATTRPPVHEMQEYLARQLVVEQDIETLNRKITAATEEQAKAAAEHKTRVDKKLDSIEDMAAKSIESLEQKALRYGVSLREEFKTGLKELAVLSDGHEQRLDEHKKELQCYGNYNVVGRIEKLEDEGNAEHVLELTKRMDAWDKEAEADVAADVVKVVNAVESISKALINQRFETMENKLASEIGQLHATFTSNAKHVVKIKDRVYELEVDKKNWFDRVEAAIERRVDVEVRGKLKELETRVELMRRALSSIEVDKEFFMEDLINKCTEMIATPQRMTFEVVDQRIQEAEAKIEKIFTLHTSGIQKIEGVIEQHNGNINSLTNACTTAQQDSEDVAETSRKAIELMLTRVEALEQAYHAEGFKEDIIKGCLEHVEITTNDKSSFANILHQVAMTEMGRVRSTCNAELIARIEALEKLPVPAFIKGENNETLWNKVQKVEVPSDCDSRSVGCTDCGAGLTVDKTYTLFIEREGEKDRTVGPLCSKCIEKALAVEQAWSVAHGKVGRTQTWPNKQDERIYEEPTIHTGPPL